MELVQQNEEIVIEDILELIRSEWPKEYGEISDQGLIDEMKKSQTKGKDVIKYLIEKGKTIGFYRYTLMEENEMEFAHILDISLLPECRGKGYGALLMQDIMKSCKEHGIEKILSRTFLSNFRSIAIHKKAGFVEAFRKGDSIVWEVHI